MNCEECSTGEIEVTASFSGEAAIGTSLGTEAFSALRRSSAYEATRLITQEQTIDR